MREAFYPQQFTATTTITTTGEITIPGVTGKLDEVISKLGDLDQSIKNIESGNLDTTAIETELQSMGLKLDQKIAYLTGIKDSRQAAIQAAITDGSEAYTEVVSELVTVMKRVEVSLNDDLSTLIQGDANNLQQLINIGSELDGIKTGVDGLVTEFNESQAKQDAQRQATEAGNQLLANIAARKEGSPVSVVIDRKKGSQIDVKIPGGFYFGEAKPIGLISLPKVNEDKTVTPGMPIENDNGEIIPHLTATNVSRGTTTDYPADWKWSIGRGDPTDSYGEQNLCFKSPDGSPIDQRYAIDVYYLKGEEQDLTVTVSSGSNDEEEPAPLPGDDTTIPI
ncbi:MAG: hypothetical protein F6K54_16255 [Okeania sp. SIO3B5]|uniref:hypothetical protein n=1 Tax=Okeania sp. SIO3B5 TaxID=2607811 RepID=UPI001400BC7E|nr:hypothetical protein [Okeania sp. SIO3B5]NEO54497.1 hypothetical protein [Okeania sp. SIO3B5]